MNRSHKPAIFFLTFFVLFFSCSENKSENIEAAKSGSVDNASQANLPLLNPIEGFSSYKFSDFPLRLQYPEEWSVHKDTIGVSFFIPGVAPEDSFIQGVTVLVDRMRGMRMTPKEYMKIIIPDLRDRTPNFLLTESVETSLGGAPAYRLGYEGSFSNKKMSYTSVFCLKDEMLCVVTYNFLASEKETYKKAAETLVSSIEFL